MKSKFINKENNNKLILLFNGWGMDESIISHLNPEGFDVCVFYHYDNDFTFDESLTKGYKDIYLIAWSMGVWASAKTLQKVNLSVNKSIAINGTLKPVNDEFGIPVSIFKGTIDNFSERNKLKFDRRMVSSKEDFEKLKSIKNKRTMENQLSELNDIYDLAIDEQEDTLDFSFDKIIIGTKDLIFPTKNQIGFWSTKANIQEIETSHFPFFSYKAWSEIIDLRFSSSIVYV